MSRFPPESRRARAEDAAAVAECVAAAYQHYVARIGKPPGPMFEDYAEIIRQHRVFVLTDGTTVVGVLVLIQRGQDMFLDNVAVHPEYQGRGLGRRLIALAEDEARRLRFAAITLYTNELMTENIELYRKLGYVEPERKAERGYRRMHMKKSLVGKLPFPVTLITGASGNLGSLLARHLVGAGRDVRLMVHRKPLPADLAAAPEVSVVRADLADPTTLPAAVRGAEVVVHFAGVLFAPRPERFLPETNTRWFGNLLEACLNADVRRIILISFPHVEGLTSVDNPATGRLDRRPISVHAQTRLEEERLLVERTRGTGATPVVLRVGMVYGRGVLMIEGARWLARHRLLGIWSDPTWIQLISVADFLRATEAAIVGLGVTGIYHVGDEKPVTLQHFLDEACRLWGYRRPMRMPVQLIYVAACLCEGFGLVTGKPSP
ncbi:MAG: GNAT family N-acetyltransferase, partial [bacterium]